ncbi:uncharacterized protein EI90DRAFT_3135107 [Cantharellus anzutake]|uniref:uncharacterized protein n=1 Tax=Cantharellus anzutake TaxID=1750568 RepID=UPI00190391C8|nr:uncharacterized protein EI90DRAFT_3135107 [Cantharellus anzutake]KAF8315534.1 hypothetical protein EI90DRAFT_3135107 [Cantharellus anzutake]
MRPMSSVLSQHSSSSSSSPLPAPHPQAPPIHFPSLAAPPPLPVFSGAHAQLSSSAVGVTGFGSHTNLVGATSPLVPSPAPVPAAFRGIPPGGFSTATVNSRRNSSALVTRNASNSRRVRTQPYESLNVAPPTSRLGISGSLIDSLEILLLPSEAEVRINMGEAAQAQGAVSVRSEFWRTRVWHQALAANFDNRLRSFQRVVHFTNVSLRMLVHDLLSQVQDELSRRGFYFHRPYDPNAPSFSLLQLHSSGRVMTTFNLPSRRLTEYYPTSDDTLEHILYEVDGFTAVSLFSKKLDGTHLLRLAPSLDHLGGPLPNEIQTVLDDGLSPPIPIHFCSGVRLYRGLATDRANLLLMLGGNETAMSDVTLCNTCRVQAISQAHLIPTDEQNDEASSTQTADETGSLSTVDNENNEGLESEVIAFEGESDLSAGTLLYPSVSAITEFADCMRGLIPDNTLDSDSLSISATTQVALVSKLQDEIIACYNDDTSHIALDKFVKSEFSFRIRGPSNTQGNGVVREVIFQLSELLFPEAPEGEGLRTSYDGRLIFFPRIYFDGIPSPREHKELAFARGVIVALSIVHLSCIPRELCPLSVLFHLGYGKSELLSERILAKLHPRLASALNEFKASGSFSSIEQIAVPYLDIDAATAAPMIATEEARDVFSHKLLLACVRGQITMEANDEEAAFRAGLNLRCSNGFHFSKLCEAYADGLEGLFKSLNASSIESFEDLVPILSFVEPQRALVLLRQHSEFQASSFGSLIEGFLRRTGWPLGTDPLGLASLSSGLGYDNLSMHLDNPGFRSQLLYRCATASDSLLSGQQIRVTFSDIPAGFSIEDVTHSIVDSAIRFQTCFGCLHIHSSVILDIVHNNAPGDRLAKFDNWLVATMMISLSSGMGGTV